MEYIDSVQELLKEFVEEDDDDVFVKMDDESSSSSSQSKKEEEYEMPSRARSGAG